MLNIYFKINSYKLKIKVIIMKNHTLSFCCRIISILLLVFFYVQLTMAQEAGNKPAKGVRDSISGKEMKLSSKANSILRVALTGTTDNTSVKGVSTNLLIYNTAKAGASPHNVYPGYYNNVGTIEKPVWKRVEVTVKEVGKNKE